MISGKIFQPSFARPSLSKTYLAAGSLLSKAPSVPARNPRPPRGYAVRHPRVECRSFVRARHECRPSRKCVPIAGDPVARFCTSTRFCTSSSKIEEDRRPLRCQGGGQWHQAGAWRRANGGETRTKPTKNFFVGLRHHLDDGFVPSRVERVYVVTLQFDLQIFIEVQDGFVCVADLEILVAHPCDFTEGPAAPRNMKLSGPFQLHTGKSDRPKDFEDLQGGRTSM